LADRRWLKRERRFIKTAQLRIPAQNFTPTDRPRRPGLFTDAETRSADEERQRILKCSPSKAQFQPKTKKMKKSSLRRRLVAALIIAGFAGSASADPIRTFTGSTGNTLVRNDDGSTGLVNIGFNLNFFGSAYSQLYVNNNGNLTFDARLGTYTPFNLLSTSTPIIAPFFGDVDTRGLGSNEVTYGSGLLGGFDAFAANYLRVGVFSRLSIYNTFQVVLINRSDIAPGDFDFEFNYALINWEAGQASGSNAQGLSGAAARAGYSNGLATSYEIAGSAVNGAFLDTSLVTGLIYSRLGVPFDGAAMDGRYTFNVRSGTVITPVLTPVPEPSTYGIFAVLGLIGIVARRRLRKN